MEYFFDRIEEYPESIKFRYLVEASQNFANAIDREKEAMDESIRPELQEEVGEIFYRSKDYEELKDSVSDRISEMLEEDRGEDAELIREYFNASAKAFAEDLEFNQAEWVFSELAFSEGSEYVHNYSIIFPDNKADERIRELATDAGDDYDFARAIRNELDDLEDEEDFKQQLEERFVKQFFLLNEPRSLEESSENESK